MITYDFRLTTGDFNIGTVYLPSDDAKNLPVIVYCHGWGGRRQLWTPTQALCDNAMREGFALVTFDFFGCGDTGGDYTQMTYARWRDNLSEIVSWVESQSFSNNTKIGCYAFSSGSTAALRMAADGQRLAFIISVGTCISVHYGMGSGGPARLFADNLEKLLSGGTANIFGIDFGIDFYIDTILNAPIYSMHKISCPVLFLQGTSDNTYRCADAKIGYDLVVLNKSNTKSAYMPIDGGEHELDNMPYEAMKRAFQWLLSIIKDDN